MRANVAQEMQAKDSVPILTIAAHNGVIVDRVKAIVT
jgi:hypothetical protein